MYRKAKASQCDRQPITSKTHLKSLAVTPSRLPTEQKMKDLYSAPSARDWVAFGEVWYPRAADMSTYPKVCGDGTDWVARYGLGISVAGHTRSRTLFISQRGLRRAAVESKRQSSVWSTGYFSGNGRLFVAILRCSEQSAGSVRAKPMTACPLKLAIKLRAQLHVRPCWKLRHSRRWQPHPRQNR
jgi:hypothetical protein